MLKRICLIIFLLIVPVVLAQSESANVILTFVDAISKEPIDDIFVKTDLNGETTSYFLEKDETLKTFISHSVERIYFKALLSVTKITLLLSLK